MGILDGGHAGLGTSAGQRSCGSGGGSANANQCGSWSGSEKADLLHSLTESDKVTGRAPEAIADRGRLFVGEL